MQQRDAEAVVRACTASAVERAATGIEATAAAPFCAVDTRVLNAIGASGTATMSTKVVIATEPDVTDVETVTPFLGSL